MPPSSRTSTPGSAGLTYLDSGVDIHAGNELVERIKPAVKRTQRPEVLAGLGGFGGLFELPWSRYRNPVLVSGTDGVGTKLKLAIELDRHDQIGIDLVAMCVNDVVVQGAEPLFFLDYFATGRLDVERAATVIRGIAAGCELAGAALIGGETAEMPGMYAAGDYDLAGFCVGIVERDRMIDGTGVQPGDRVLGLDASGPHSNGYSLIRRILADHPGSLDLPCGDGSLADALLMPTRIYVKPLLALQQQVEIRALAHITGGGLIENLPRVLPAGCGAVIDLASWSWPPVFRWLQQHGRVATREMLRTFNCGIGMTACVPESAADRAIALLAADGIGSRVIGRIEAHAGEPEVQLAGEPPP